MVRVGPFRRIIGIFKDDGDLVRGVGMHFLFGVTENKDRNFRACSFAAEFAIRLGFAREFGTVCFFANLSRSARELGTYM